MPRSIYLATRNREKFAFLTGGYSLVDDASEADIVIVDLSEPVATKDWLHKRTTVRPLILTALDGYADPVMVATLNLLYKHNPTIQRHRDDVMGRVAEVEAQMDAPTRIDLLSLLPLTKMRQEDSRR